jgi:endonuclease G
MPSAAIIHAACFAVGAVVGGGVVTAVASRKRQIPITTSANTSVAPPIIEMGQSGGAQLSNAVTASALSSPVLKYGHPGELRAI